ncbi:MAG: chromate transporter, partial [Oscillospiraceae bacterium]
MKEILDLFLTFANIGVTTFGGGYAMLPILEREVVDKRKWATSEELMNYFAVGQCTPGIIAVNTATFIGYKNKGILGGIAATVGVVFPSLVIIMVIAAFIQNFAELEIVSHAFAGIRAVVAVIVVNAVIKFFKAGCKDFTGVLICIMAFVAAGIFNISAI